MSCTATRHGTATAYQAYGCRCDEARDAQRRYKKRWLHARSKGAERRIDATGTRLRMQALMRLGWPSHEIMDRLGYSKGGNWILYADRLNVSTVERVRVLFDELWNTPGPSKWTRTWATRRGYPMPMDLDDDMLTSPPCHSMIENVPNLTSEKDGLVDEVAVERLIGGDLNWQSLSHAERLEHDRTIAS